MTLEDIDRGFPRTGESTSKISLTCLLNCLDGLSSSSNGGVLTIGTANSPTLLDATILKTPGRFDRVVAFPNPLPDLRREYFRRLHISGDALEEAVLESKGCSFAMLREAHVIGAQRSFEQNRADITAGDLLHGIRCLRQSLTFRSLQRE
ncbi:MAG: AAA family ATPase [Terriglobia bacterium]